MNTLRHTLCALMLSAATASSAIPNSQFVIPNSNAKPWTFWYWMYGAVSEEGIRADLQGMKDIGLGGAYLMPIRGADQKPEHGGTARQLSPRFWQMVDCALATADSLELSLGVHISDGFALAGGPWIRPEESMRHTVSADTVVSLPTSCRELAARASAAFRSGCGAYRLSAAETDAYKALIPAAPKGCIDWRDIAVYVLPAESEATRQPIAVKPSAEASIDSLGVIRASRPCTVDYDYGQPYTVRSVIVTPGGNNIQSQRICLWASTDGSHYSRVRQLTPPRQGWQGDGYPFTYALPETTARYWRLTWTPDGTEPGAEDLDPAKWKPNLKIRSLCLSPTARIDQWEGKAGLVWRQAEGELGIRNYELGIGPSGVIPNSKFLIPNSRRLRILRLGHASTGHTNETAGDGRGLECSKFSAAAVRKQIDSWFGQFKQRPHASAIRHIHIDSWECGSQNWSDTFADEFCRRRGYDLMPYLPALAGYPACGAAKADSVLYDVRLTINDLVNDIFFTTARERADHYGCTLTTESVAPTMMADGLDHYRYADIPMGEYWLGSPTHDKPNDMLDATSGAHIYGKQVVGAESCTQLRGTWDETPATVKPLIDRNYCLGMNRVVFHVCTHNPWTDRRPGMTLEGIGFFFQRDNTWYPEARGLVDYVTRCDSMLQRGRPVADIAVYSGDAMPRRALRPEQIVDMLPAMAGPQRLAAEHSRRRNAGQPLEESPVGVTHAAGIVDPKDWVNPLRGYQYDTVNPDALPLIGSAADRPFSPVYRCLVVPQDAPLTAASRARLDSLERTGMPVIRRPLADSTLQRVANLGRDITLPDRVGYTHRVLDDGRDLYFVCNQRPDCVTFPIRLRRQKDMTVYDPVTDRHYPAADSLTLAPYASVFLEEANAATPSEARPQFLIPNSKFLITEPWALTFEANGASLRSDTLPDWSRQASDSIRYYSGHATYKTSFRLGGKWKGRRVVLRLGTVRDIAAVSVNGHDCGLAWTAPYEVDITDAVRRGRNSLQIRIVNTWANALLGADTGHAPFSNIWTNAKYRRKDPTPLPAGLLGPLQILTR